MNQVFLLIHFLPFYTCEATTRRGMIAEGRESSAGSAPGDRPAATSVADAAVVAGQSVK
jgi:hypothetical protein